MGQIEHNIYFDQKAIHSPYHYFLSFEDYLRNTEEQKYFHKDGKLFYINPSMIYKRYNIKNCLTGKGMLHVVNLERCIGLLAQKEVNLVEEIIEQLVSSHHCEEKDNGIFLVHDFYNPIYGLKPGWLSGMAQGMFASVCARLFAITQKQMYREYACKAVNAMVRLISNGGCRISEKEWWFEEYVDKRRNSFVLNGNIFSILSFWDMGKYINPSYNDSFDKSLACLKKKLHRFTEKEFSFYDLLFHKADDSYNRLHIEQINALISITDSEIPRNIFTALKYTKLKRNLFHTTIWMLNKFRTLRRTLLYANSIHQ